jgi:hypothetical protein
VAASVLAALRVARRQGARPSPQLCVFGDHGQCAARDHINMNGIMHFDTLMRGPMAVQNMQKAASPAKSTT